MAHLSCASLLDGDMAVCSIEYRRAWVAYESFILVVWVTMESWTGTLYIELYRNRVPDFSGVPGTRLHT